MTAPCSAGSEQVHHARTVSAGRQRVRKRADLTYSTGLAAVIGPVDLSEVLTEFARTMLTDFPIQGILDRLVKRIVDVMPVTAAGVTLISSELAPALRGGVERVRAAV